MPIKNNDLSPPGFEGLNVPEIDQKTDTKWILIFTKYRHSYKGESNSELSSSYRTVCQSAFLCVKRGKQPEYQRK